MALTGKQKAAMLLMSLDIATAAELLKGLETGMVQEIAMELVRIDELRQRNANEQVKIAKEFWDSFRQKQTKGFSIKGFFNEVLVNVLGKDKANEIQAQIKKATKEIDPFMAIRSVNTDELVLALEKEHPQAAAVILSQLPANKSAEVLNLLDEGMQISTVRRMTNIETVGSDIKQRIAFTVWERLKTLKGKTLPEGREQSLRKLAIMLSGLSRDLRDSLVDEIAKHDKETATMIRRLMVTWEDIPSVADRSLQETLRTIEPNKLAMALYGAEEEIVQKIRSNISERVCAQLDEETSLMQEPLEKEILDAREEVIKPLREAYEQEKLRFVGR